jgi:hypothetical protein
VSDDTEESATGSPSDQSGEPSSVKPEEPHTFKPESPPSDGPSRPVSAPPHPKAQPQSRNRSLWMLVGVAVVVLVAAIGGIGYVLTRSPNPGTRPTPAAVLDGTYRFDYDYTQRTINGALAATHNVAIWWALRSSCTASGCAATGTRLDDTNHQVAYTPALTTQARFGDGRWQRAPLQHQVHLKQCLGTDQTVVAGADTVSSTWSLEPQAGGTLRGVQTDTYLTNACGKQGEVARGPVVATRTGDAPPGVAVADPATVTASPATSSPAPAVAGPQLNGSYRVDFDYAHQTVNGVPVPNPGQNGMRWWAFRSLCTSAGCVATGAMLSPANHQEAAGTDPRVLHFADGHWQDTPYLVNNPYPCPPATGQTGSPTVLLTVAWSLDPQPDGTLRGVETDTVVASECGGQGRTYQEPMVVTRDGDVPPAVVLADPTLF